MSTILDGKAVAERVRKRLHTACLGHERKPHLFVFLSHPHPASEIYVKAKQKACLEVGFQVTVDVRPHVTTETLVQAILEKNKDPSIDGILVQMPLHPNVNAELVLATIDPNKDVDGLHPMNLGKLAASDPTGFVPCTPLGIWTLMKEYGIELTGRHVTIIGRSRIVGTPLALLLSRSWEGANATVTLAHSKTHNLSDLTLTSDIIVTCVGKPHTLTEEMVREGATVIDVGINRLHSNKLVGDVDFEKVRKKTAFITPVPGGIGPMTIASLLENTYKAFSH